MAIYPHYSIFRSKPGSCRRCAGTAVEWLQQGNAEAGWRENSDYGGLTLAQKNALPDSVIKTNSFFQHFDDEDICGTNGSAIVGQPAMYGQLLADAIPALSKPAGRATLEGTAGDGNRDYMTHYGTYGFRRGLYADGNWPDDNNRWLHSHIIQVAYPFNSKAFDQIVTDGGLK